MSATWKHYIDNQMSFKRLLQEYSNSANRFIILTGSGFSALEGLPTWKELRDKAADKIIASVIPYESKEKRIAARKRIETSKKLIICGRLSR